MVSGVGRVVLGAIFWAFISRERNLWAGTMAFAGVFASYTGAKNASNLGAFCACLRCDKCAGRAFVYALNNIRFWYRKRMNDFGPHSAQAPRLQFAISGRAAHSVETP